LAAAAFMAAPLLAHPPTQLTPDAEKATAKEIEEFRKSLAEAIARKDAAALRQMYAASFVHTHASGKLDGRDARIAAALAGNPLIETAPTRNLVIRVPGGWTGIAIGISSIKSPVDGKAHALRWTAIYIRTDISWQLAASHETRVGEEK
jgi:ketosteroid isomerase-like protein